MAPHGDTLRASEGSGLDHVDPSARRVDPDAESRQVTVPEHGVLVIDRKTVHNAFRQGKVLKFRHAMVLLKERESAAYGPKRRREP